MPQQPVFFIREWTHWPRPPSYSLKPHSKEDVSMSEYHDMALCDLRPLNSPAAIRDEGIPSTA